MQINQTNISPSPFGFGLAGQEQKQPKSALDPTARKEEEKQPYSVDISGRGKSAANQNQQLSEEEKKVVEELKKIDRETRAHEQAHMGAGGQYVTGGASYEYEQGPDHNRYAVGGEVQIDTSDIPGDPTATKLKMQQVRRAALAPANPSPQDLRVAAEASQREMQAAAEEVALRRQETQGGEATGVQGGKKSGEADSKQAASKNGEKGQENTSSFLNSYAVGSYQDSAGFSQIFQQSQQKNSLSIFA